MRLILPLAMLLLATFASIKVAETFSHAATAYKAEIAQAY